MKYILTLNKTTLGLHLDEAARTEQMELLVHNVMKGDPGTHPYISLERLRHYLYRVTFDSLPEDNGGEGVISGGCSSYVKDGKLYRNFDWNYDDAATFIVRARDFEGVSTITGLNDGALNDSIIAQLPYRVVDGRNNHGIMVSTHVVFNDWEWTGSGERSVNLTRLPFLVLSRVKSMATIATDLDGILANLYASEGLSAMGYLLQLLVTDGSTTYALLPPASNGQPYVLQDISSNPKLTNFRWVDRAEVSRFDMDIQTRPTGIERFNAMPCELEDLRFTEAYEQPTRLSEFIGLRGATKNSSDAEIEAIYNDAHVLHLDRERDGKTWQTMHSVVYGDGMEALFIQENWRDDCIRKGPQGESFPDAPSDGRMYGRKNGVWDVINSLPPVIGHAGKFLKTDGEGVSWRDICADDLKELIGAFAAGTVWIDTDGRWRQDATGFTFSAPKNNVAEWLSIGNNATSLYEAGYHVAKRFKIYPKYWDLSRLTSLTEAFQYADFGPHADLSNWDTSKITSAVSTFAHCYAGVLDISMLDFSNVVDNNLNQNGIKGIFSYATIDTLILGNMATGNLTTFNEAFRDLKTTSPLDLSGLDFSNLQKVTTAPFRYWLYDCTAPKVIFPENFSIAGDSAANMVHHMPELLEVDLTGFDTTNITSLSEIPKSCPKLVTFGMPAIPNGCRMYDNFYESANIENIFMREGATFAVTLPYLSGLNKLTVDSVKTLLSHASPTPDAGATLSFNSALYNSFSAEDKAEIDELRNIAVGHGWTITNMG